VLLEYETLDGRQERQIAFVVEGELKEDYEAGFAKGRGLEILADLLTPHAEPIEERIKQQVAPKIAQRLGKFDDAEMLASQVATVRQQMDDARQQLAQTDRADTRSQLQDQIRELEAKLAAAEAERNARKVKYLWTPEIRAKLWEALRTAKERLLILSGWISSEVVDERFIDAIDAALKRGVKIWIGYGFDKESRRGQEHRNKGSWREAEDALASLQRSYPDQLVVRDVGRSHEKRLICDNRFTFGGSFNLLSFSGEQRGHGKVRHEGADLIEDPEFCEQLYNRYLRMFFAPKMEPSRK
jgi:phosphatidylserine/phosphatidylglycerophosphate/cardiolipin synthase-like enzyme